MRASGQPPRALMRRHRYRTSYGKGGPALARFPDLDGLGNGAAKDCRGKLRQEAAMPIAGRESRHQSRRAAHQRRLQVFAGARCPPDGQHSASRAMCGAGFASD